MSMNTPQYQAQLLELLPRGSAWPRETDTALGRLLGGLAEEFARVDATLDSIAAESLPSQVTQLIAEWEAEYGLPNNGTSLANTLRERRNELTQKYQQYGSQSRDFLIAMAYAMGHEITITEYREAIFGGEFGGSFWGVDWVFVVQANLKKNASSDATQRLSATLRRLLHAHKLLIVT